MLSRSGIHAIRALVVLSGLRVGEYRGTTTVADAIGAPRNYLGKILQLLAKHGLVESQKGIGGGFRLARAPKEISLFDIVEAIEDVSRWSACILGRPGCSNENPCAVHGRWAPVREAYLQLLQQTRISDLISTQVT